MQRNKVLIALLGLIIIASGLYLYNWNRPESRLIRAVSHNDVPGARKLLEKNPYLGHSRYPYISPLHTAAELGYSTMAQLLINKSFPIDSRDNRGATPLCKAAWFRELPMELLLLRSGASAKIHDNKGGTPLHYASGASPVDLALALAGAVSDSDRSGDIHLRQAKVASILIDAGADVNAVSQNGTTPLHLAAGAGNPQLVKLLVIHHADVFKKDDKGNTALHYAARTRSVEVVKLLLAKGADAHTKNKNGELPIDIAEKKDNSEVARILK